MVALPLLTGGGVPLASIFEDIMLIILAFHYYVFDQPDQQKFTDVHDVNSDGRAAHKEQECISMLRHFPG